MDDFQKITVALEALLAQKPRVLIAIDGMCAAGKSTAARALCERYAANVYHMDDFFLPAERKTQSRLAEPGGNVEYERFQKEVLAPLKLGQAVSYRRFDCETGTLEAAREITPQALEIVEGVYSAHPYFDSPYDLTVFLRVDPFVQKARIAARNGAMLPRFVNEWIPLEQRYFEAFEIEKKSDLVVCVI